MGRRFGLAVGATLAAVLVTAWMVSALAGEAPRTLPVERGDLVLGVDVSGTVEATESIQLSPPLIEGMWSFKIAYLAPEGSRVEAGTPVMRLDTEELERKLLQKMAERDSADKELERERTELERQRRESELQLAEARAELRRARLKTDVPEELVGGHELAKAQIDLELAGRKVEHLEAKRAFEQRRARAQITALEEQRDRAAGRVEEIQQSIESLTVRAPRAGTVIYAANWQGEKKQPGDQVWRQEKVVEIPNLSSMEGHGMVDEADAGRLAVGQPVRLTLDAHPDVTYAGTVARIHNTVQRRSVTNPLKVVRLGIDLAETDTTRMRPGMRFRGTVEIERLKDVVIAPAESIFSGPEGPVAFLRQWLGVEAIRPEVGRRNEEWVEIRAGLEPGQRLLTDLPEGG